MADVCPQADSLPLAVLMLEAAGSNSSRMNATIAVLTTPSRPTDGHESGRSESATICVHLWTVLLHRQLPRLVRIERVEGGRELSGLRAQVLLEDPSVGSDHERHDARRAPAHRVGDDRESADQVAVGEVLLRAANGSRALRLQKCVAIATIGRRAGDVAFVAQGGDYSETSAESSRCKRSASPRLSSTRRRRCVTLSMSMVRQSRPA